MSDTRSPLSRLTRIRVNGAFRSQRITGQQRYATEIAARLLKRPGVSEGAGAGTGPDSPLSAWARTQFAGLRRGGGERLVSLTSRGPVVARRHVVVVHDLFVLDHPEWYSKKYVATHAPILRAQIRSAELLAAVSEPVAQRLRETVGRGKRVVTVPNAPAQQFRIGLTPPEACRTHGLLEGEYVLAVGSQEPRKNLDRLIAAHAELPANLRTQYPLVLVGAAASIYAASGASDDEGVIRLGYVDDDELSRLYSAAAVVSFTPLDEGFGLPAVEAIASGSDLLASDIPVLRWVCDDMATYVNPLSVPSITAGLRNALENPTSSTVRRQRAEAVRRRFSWEASAATLYDAIGELSTAAPAALPAPDIRPTLGRAG